MSYPQSPPRPQRTGTASTVIGIILVILSAVSIPHGLGRSFGLVILAATHPDGSNPAVTIGRFVLGVVLMLAGMVLIALGLVRRALAYRRFRAANLSTAASPYPSPHQYSVPPQYQVPSPPQYQYPAPQQYRQQPPYPPGPQHYEPPVPPQQYPPQGPPQDPGRPR